jgi:hypothetical protein
MAEKSDYELTEAEAAVLDAATGDATAAAGAAGGAIGGAIGGGIGAGRAGAAGGAAGGRKGGASGGRFGARFLKPQTAETTVEVPCDPDTARERARAAIARSGEVIEDPNKSGDGSEAPRRSRWARKRPLTIPLVPRLRKRSGRSKSL